MRRQRVHKWLPRLVRTALLTLIVYYLGSTLWQNWTSVTEVVRGLDWGWFALACAMLAVSFMLLPLPTWLAVRTADPAAAWRTAVVVYFTSQAAKYLPGGIWVVPGRTLLYCQRFMIRPQRAAYLVILEMLALCLGAGLTGLTNVTLGTQQALLAVALLLVVIGLIAGVYLVQADAIRHLLRRTPLAALADRLDVGARLPAHIFLLMTGASIGFWIVLGTGVYVLLNALPSLSARPDPLHLIGVFALAWLIGFLVIVLPAGLGVRESALALLLQAWLPPAEAVLVAVLARFGWTMVEAVFILIALLLLRERPAVPSPSGG